MLLRFSFFLTSTVTAAIAAVALIACSSEEREKGEDRKPETSSTQDSRKGDKLSRAGLLAARDEPGLLEAQLDWVLESGRMKNDPEIKNLYRANFHKFSPEVLARLTLSKNGFGGGGEIQKFVANQNNSALLRDYFVALGKDGSSKQILMQHLGSDSSLFAPDSIHDILEELPKISRKELQALGSGIRSRISIHTKDPDSRIEMLNDYFSTIDEPLVLGKLASAAVDAMETDEAIAWLKQGDADAMATGDRALIRTLKPSDYDKGFDLINHFIENDQTPRAQKAIEEFLFRYAASNPAEALAWVDGMDNQVRTNQMIVTAFRSYYDSHPEKALEILEGTSDPARKALYQRCIKSSQATKR